MSKEAFEDQIKSILDNAKYEPTEQQWLKFQKALNNQETSKKSVLVPLTTKRMKFHPRQWLGVAAIAGVIATTAILFNTKEHQPMEIASSVNNNSNIVSIVATKPEHPNTNHSSTTQPTVQTTGTTVLAKRDRARVLLASIVPNHEMQPVPTEALSGTDYTQLSMLPSVAVSKKVTNYDEMPVDQKFKGRSRTFNMNMGDQHLASNWNSSDEAMYPFEDPFIYGANLRVGTASIGKVQFVGGLTIKREFGTRFFIEANAEATYTYVQLKNKMYYSTHENGSSMNLGSGLGQMQDVANASTVNTYSNYVLGVGFSPMFGVNVNKSIALAIGPDMSRNFNNKLILDDNPTLEAATLKHTVPQGKWASLWDAGLNAKLSLKLTEHVDAVAHYRKGMVNYMTDFQGKEFKNSNISVGLHLNFNP